MKTIKISTTVLAFAALFGTSLASGNAEVFTETNSLLNNQVLSYGHGANGALTLLGSFATGGMGTGAGLGSQGALTLSDDGRFLFAVDAGSNDVAVFDIRGHRMREVGRFASGGTMPVSVTSHDKLVYVLNAGGAGNIAGFRMQPNGALEPISNSSRGLSQANAGPAQIEFTPSGDAIVVTEKTTNAIDTWPVVSGRPGDLVTTPSVGTTPFGFGFDRRGRMFVSEAAGGAANGSSASSYVPEASGWQAVTAAAATNQTAACWLAVSPKGQFVFTANAGSGSISGFAVSPNGALNLLDPSGIDATVGAGSHPVDLAFGRGGQLLYSLANGNGTLNVFWVSRDGSLAPVASASGIPTSAQGLAAR